jgi:hypothetical protein
LKVNNPLLGFLEMLLEGPATKWFCPSHAHTLPALVSQRNDRFGEPSLLSPTLAIACIGAGDTHKALGYVEQCFRDENPSCWDFETFPAFDSLRKEPRFKAVIAAMGP